jgi:hypothetical protein
MITVNCSQCKALLEMDDAFAGGVCRCHYCGTIQSVPSNARRVRVATATVAAAPPRSNGAAPAGGLDALADVVASGGSARGPLRSPPPQPVAPAAVHVDYARPPQQRSMLLPLMIALGVILLLLVLVGYLVVGGSTTTVTVGPAPGVEPPPVPVVVPKGPHFVGISLEGAPSVVYVLDRGQATAELFDTLKETTYRSLESLKPGQKFQIIFWDNADAPASYPAEGLANVSADEIEAARTQFADVLAGGRANAQGAVERAAKSEPAVIILVTGKAFYLEPELVDAVREATRGKKTKVHGVALSSDDGNTVLKNIAGSTKGEFRVISAKELRDYSY